MSKPDQRALTDTASGRVSMPFLPTVAVVALLGLASLYCPSSQLPEAARAEVAPAPGSAPTAFAPTAFAPPATAAALPARLPAPLAFAVLYPAGSAAVPPALMPTAPALVASAASPARPANPRPASALASAARHPCPGRLCPETPLRGPDPFGPARAEAADPSEGGLPPLALPFTATVAGALAPAIRAVGEAADRVRGGAASARGSVALAVAECLR